MNSKAKVGTRDIFALLAIFSYLELKRSKRDIDSETNICIIYIYIYIPLGQ